MSVENFDKILNWYDEIYLCGQVSDPIHHPQFPLFLKMAKDKGVFIQIHTASSHKSRHWFVEMFKLNPEAHWVFGIDGAPEDSHIYRVNQDGQKLFEVMVDSTKYLKSKSINSTKWYYIVFKYNQDDIEYCKRLANYHGIEMVIIRSTRWYGNGNQKPDDEFISPYART